MKFGEGKITTKSSGNGGYKSYWLYLPSKISKDSIFPFEEDEKVSIEIEGDSLIIRKLDGRINFLRKLGIKNITLIKLLEKKAIDKKNHKLIYYKDKKYTVREINQNSNKISHGLIDLVNKMSINQPKIAIIMRNCMEYIYSWIGTIKAGHISVPIYTKMTNKMTKYVLDNSDTEILFLDYKYFEKFKKIEKDLLKIKKVIVFNAPKDFKFNDKYINFDEINTNKKENPKVNIFDQDPVQIIYTQGNTGKPKGVVYRNIVLPAFNFGFDLHDIGLNENDLIYDPLPLAHPVNQFFCIISSMIYNNSILILNRFNKNKFWERIQKYKPKVFCYLGGYLGELIYNKPTENERDHSIKWAYGFGAEKILWEAFEQRFNIKLHEAYTLIEGSCICINKVGSDGNKLGSVGKPLGIFDIKILDENGNELPKGSKNIGEIAAKYKTYDKPEYYKEPNTSSKVIRKNDLDLTGDYGYLDKDGYLYYVDRKEGIIEKAGEIVYARYIQEIADSHPYIMTSGVVKKSINGSQNEEVKIFAVRFKNKITYEDLYDHLYRNLAYFMVPRYFEFIKVLPRNSGGNIIKRILKDNFLNSNTWDSFTKDFVEI